MLEPSQLFLSSLEFLGRGCAEISVYPGGRLYPCGTNLAISVAWLLEVSYNHAHSLLHALSDSLSQVCGSAY